MSDKSKFKAFVLAVLVILDMYLWHLLFVPMAHEPKVGVLMLLCVSGILTIAVTCDLHDSL